MRRPHITPHLFVSDGSRDWRDRPLGCQRCPRPHDHPVHDVDEWLAEVHQDEARRLGERNAA